LALHDAVARDPPFSIRINYILVSRSAETVNEKTCHGQNVLHIVLKGKNVPEWQIYYLGNLVQKTQHMRKLETIE